MSRREAVDEIKTLLDSRGVRHVKVGVFDVDGVLNGKYMARDKFLSALEGGFGFCDVVLGWDVDDQLYDNTTVTGWHKGYGDAPVRLLPETWRELPFEDNTLFVLGEFSGEHEAICPRAALRRVLARAEEAGLSALAACEYEFLVVEETAASLAGKHFRAPTPHGSGNFGYSVLRNSVNTGFYHGLLDLSDSMGFPLEGLHEETGPGALEAAIRVDGALAAADKGALFKTFTKVLAQRSGLMASFMAKWESGMPGQGGHVHLSLSGPDGAPLFRDEAAADGISDMMRHAIGGLQRLAPALTAMVAPTVNSYRRLVPGYWAPTAASWGIDNRTVAIRAIMGSAKSQRVEFRIPGADANPYLAVAAVLGAALWGIENRIEPAPAATGNAYLQTFPDSLQLPRTLTEAAGRLRASAEARDLFGDTFVDHFAATREWEERQFLRHVSDWELKRYFEII
ncbi:glutamine synthetase [Enterovirga sp.]|uniref:glutamine synthetase family protein n=1 Tax=Enterovirga sp. TaxID=2026350 RepID=UPI0026281156|nr:glutamine synthetase [Enterovirga sp.]MDB5590978.1 glutamine synthetase family protein [Enterovirga sp.]